jgi:hypothetical protein
MISSRQFGEHSSDCYALKHFEDGTWNTPWCIGEHVFADTYGNENGRYDYVCWLKFRCNCTKCPAVLMIRESLVLELLQPPIGKKVRRA